MCLNFNFSRNRSESDLIPDTSQSSPLSDIAPPTSFLTQLLIPPVGHSSSSLLSDIAPPPKFLTQLLIPPVQYSSYSLLSDAAPPLPSPAPVPSFILHTRKWPGKTSSHGCVYAFFHLTVCLGLATNMLLLPFHLLRPHFFLPQFLNLPVPAGPPTSPASTPPPPPPALSVCPLLPPTTLAPPAH